MTNRQDSQHDKPEIVPSMANKYNPEIHTAIATKLTKIGPDPPSRPNLRIVVAAITANKLTRIAIRITVIFAIITIWYESMNLMPAFLGTNIASKGLEIQAKSETDASQSTARGFVQECLNRKISLLIEPYVMFIPSASLLYEMGFS